VTPRTLPRRVGPFGPIASLAALLGLGGLLIIGVASAGRLDPRLSLVPGLDDHALHAACVTRIARGEPYYAAVGSELRARGYPSASVPNWRTPLHYRFVAALGTARSKALLLAAGILAAVAGAAAFSRRSPATAVAAAIVLLGTLLPILFKPGRASLFGEQWAGVLIALSLGAYHLRRFTAGALTGVLAVFMRELAAPYGVVCGILALARRRRAESAVWIAGGVAYAIYYAVHVGAVLNAIQPGDYAWPQPWVRFLGWPFVLQTAWANGWTMILPYAATPVLAVLGLGGTAARGMPSQLRISLLLYVALFSVVGQEFNWYWGWVVAPLWGYALLYAPAGLARLARNTHELLRSTRPVA
jgi:hypothetical protein